MPELPDIVVYLESLGRFVGGRRLLGLRIFGPSVLKSFDPPAAALHGRKVCGVERIGKRIVFAFEDDLFVVLHLMIAGRLHWKKAGASANRKISLAAFDFEHGTLMLTEASPRKRASLWVVAGREALRTHDPGGLEVLEAAPETFAQALRSENHTLKRALTDPRLFSGIGNAYSDEILHRARLSPMKLTSRIDDEEVRRLHAATVAVLSEWTQRLREQTGESFPEKVTAFRPEMAVHGKAGQACPVCGAKVCRIAYADNETNYCAVCQNEGRLLADRALSRLLREDWPKTLTELEERVAAKK
ncbi:MAG TPA: DNA-formamidopyrimidine glycosylase family protein [Candidatus Limnocylindrales bacterium]|nr:DNA-formamidopyrimidine glycosylase family protein [Candidatus Limnocylindrales bacterium]